MPYPATELSFANDEIGYGLIVIEFIPKGTIMWVLELYFDPKKISRLLTLFNECFLHRLREIQLA